MASFEIEISRTAEKQLRNLAEKDQLRVVRAMLALADEPHPRGSRKLSGYDDVFRIRVGRFRVLYSVYERRLVILVLKIGQRKDVYR
jgi:mRNA interferase RelE/StbE